jgi:hypothetical protein
MRGAPPKNKLVYVCLYLKYKDVSVIKLKSEKKVYL